MKMEEFIQGWVNRKNGRVHCCGQFQSIEKDTELIYRMTKIEVKDAKTRLEYLAKLMMEEPVYYKKTYSDSELPNPKHVDVVAIRLPKTDTRDEMILGNASRLKYCGRHRRANNSPAQQELFRLNVPMLPFSVFDQSGMDVRRIEIIDMGGEEKLLLPKQKRGRDGDLTDEAIIKKVFVPYGTVKPKDIGEVLSKDEEVNEYVNNQGYKKGIMYHVINRDMLEERHFVGSLLLRLSGQYYLFDCDRRELEHYRFNPFMTEIPGEPKTIEEAYQLLKPDLVLDAEKQKKKVLRQGEWFFVPVDEKELPPLQGVKPGIEKLIEEHTDLRYKYNVESVLNDYHEKPIDKETIKPYIKRVLPKYRKQLMDRIRAYNKKVKGAESVMKMKQELEKQEMTRATLRAGVNSPNNVEGKIRIQSVGGVQRHYVKGKVTHSGRQHEPLTLEGWHLAIPNTGIKSFTITGGID